MNLGGTLAMQNTTLFANSVEGGGGIPAGSGSALGGGVFNLGGTVTIRSSTFVNAAVSGARGIDVYNKAWGSDSQGVPAEYRGDARVVIDHSIMGGSPTAGDQSRVVNDEADAGDLVASVSGAENIIVSTEGTVAAMSISTANPMLPAPADNGGRTPTIALPALSALAPTSAVPCMDLFSEGEDALLQEDQRGAGRPAGSCDPGAYQRSMSCSEEMGGSECAGACQSGFCCACPAGTAHGCTVCSVADGATHDGICASRAEATACGDADDTECTNADACDGAGVCLPNHAADGTVCDDGLFCTTTSVCTTGICTGSGDPCGDGSSCNETSAMCLVNCGNGILDEGEACDEGAANGSDTCTDQCSIPGADMDAGVPNDADAGSAEEPGGVRGSGCAVSRGQQPEREAAFLFMLAAVVILTRRRGRRSSRLP